MDTITLVGFIAGTLTTVAYIPQVIRSWRLKETKDISLTMLVLYAAGVFLWLVYGFWTNALPIIAANGISVFLILILLGITSVPLIVPLVLFTPGPVREQSVKRLYRQHKRGCPSHAGAF